VQVGWLLGRGRKVEPMLWISLVVIVLFGGATIWFNNEMFIKWKPSILYWLFGFALLAGRLVWNRNRRSCRRVISSLTSLKAAGPDRFFAAMG
jgi:intracellular septation protein